MDLIKFDLNGDLVDVDNGIKSTPVHLEINGEPHPQLLDVASVLGLLGVSWAEFNIFTCECGVPECAGYWEPILHVVEGNTVTWTVPKPADGTADEQYSGLKPLYRFDLSSFTETLEGLKASLQLLEHNKIAHSTLISYDISDRDEQISVINPVAKTSAAYQSTYLKEQEFHYFLLKEVPDLINSEFRWTYRGVSINEFKTEVEYLISGLLNSGPCYTSSMPWFLRKSKLAIKAIRMALQGDLSLYLKLAKHAYAKFKDEPPILSAIRYHGAVIDVDTFDSNFLKLEVA